MDPKEIAKFAALAQEWWAPEGAFAALHRMNPARLAFIRDHAVSHFALTPRGRKPLAGLAIADIGCGGGLVSIPLARMGAAVTGVDAGQDAIGAARAQAAMAGVEGVTFQNTEAESLVAEGRRFDVVTALEILEHVPDPAALLQTIAALVRPGGLLMVSTINRTIKARALAITAAENILNWAPKGAHDFDKLIKPEEIIAALPDIAWSVPMGLSFSLTDRVWRQSGDVSMNYLMAGKKP